MDLYTAVIYLTGTDEQQMSQELIKTSFTITFNRKTK